MKKSQPAFSMHGRLDGAQGDSNPGPGTYEINDSPRGGFKLRGKPKDKNYTDTPGPGEYDINDKLSHRGKATGPNYSFGEKVGQPGADQNPGPGQYSPENSPRVNLPAWSMGKRTRGPKHDDVPGPGQYDPKDNKRVPVYAYKPGKLD